MRASLRRACSPLASGCEPPWGSRRAAAGDQARPSAGSTLELLPGLCVRLVITERTHDPRREYPPSSPPLQKERRHTDTRVESEMASGRRERLGWRRACCESIPAGFGSALCLGSRLELGTEPSRSTMRGCVGTCAPPSPRQRYHHAIDPQSQPRSGRAVGVDGDGSRVDDSAPPNPGALSGGASTSGLRALVI